MHAAQLRPTRKRLTIAMAVATCFVSLVLALLSRHDGAPRSPIAARAASLTVHIGKSAVDAETDVEPNDEADNELLRDAVLAPREIAPHQERLPANLAAKAAGANRTSDWRETVAETVATIGAENARQRGAQSSMWRKTHSIMFRPEREFVLADKSPVIPDFRFRPQIHVGGLGVTIGSCFIGIPIVGVPVEERTVAIRLFVCAQDSR